VTVSRRRAITLLLLLLFPLLLGGCGGTDRTRTGLSEPSGPPLESTSPSKQPEKTTETQAPMRIPDWAAHFDLPQNSCPVVSPSGASLAYLSGPHKKPAPAKLVVVQLDSAGNLERDSKRVLLPNAESCPQWSPDSRRLAVVAEGQDWATPELRVMTVDGRARRLAILPALQAHFAWSPDSDAVAYLTEDSVWIAPLKGGDAELFWRSTPTPDTVPQDIPLPRAPVSLSWLRSGELAVTVLSDRVSDGWPYVPEGPNVLHIIDVESTHHEKIVIADHEVPLFSPDDSRIAYIAGDGRRHRVYDRATGLTVTLRPQLDDGAFWITGLAWSQDGEWLLATAQRGPDSQGGPFAEVSFAADGSSVELLTPWTRRVP
jgi:Tol biopolymer transport system component